MMIKTLTKNETRFFKRLKNSLFVCFINFHESSDVVNTYKLRSEMTKILLH